MVDKQQLAEPGWDTVIECPTSDWITCSREGASSIINGNNTPTYVNAWLTHNHDGQKITATK
ncbi:hypothetical protein [Acinetobacter baumannii]|uniref:hypothetical protein n=1 Tax=Acinetobacter baumannii TaxID=470 RepID=UPI00339A3DCD